jgi:hypothetical protein
MKDRKFEQTYSALVKRMTIVDREAAEIIYRKTEDLQPGITKRIKSDDLAALIENRMMLENVIRDCVGRIESANQDNELLFAKLTRSPVREYLFGLRERIAARLREMKRRLTLAIVVIHTGGLG